MWDILFSWQRKKERELAKTHDASWSFHHKCHMTTCLLVIGKASHVTKPYFWSQQEAKSHVAMRGCISFYWKGK